MHTDNDMVLCPLGTWAIQEGLERYQLFDVHNSKTACVCLKVNFKCS